MEFSLSRMKKFIGRINEIKAILHVENKNYVTREMRAYKIDEDHKDDINQEDVDTPCSSDSGNDQDGAKKSKI